jgi:hypothetical protein
LAGIAVALEQNESKKMIQFYFLELIADANAPSGLTISRRQG